MEILNQLGELFLEAVPTVILVFLFYLFLRWSFFNPMERVLSERQARAAGALQEAETTRAAAQEKLRAYNAAMKKARAELFAEQEAGRRRVLDERQATINAARTAAQQGLLEAKKAVAGDVQDARTQLEQSSEGLANTIAEAILAGRPDIPGDTRSGDLR